MHSLYRSSTRGPEDDSVESKHVAPLSHMFNFNTVVFDGTSPPVISQTLRDGTPQVTSTLHLDSNSINFMSHFFQAN